MIDSRKGDGSSGVKSRVKRTVLARGFAAGATSEALAATAAWASPRQRVPHPLQSENAKGRPPSKVFVDRRMRHPRSEGETTTDCRTKVAVVVIGDAGAMRNGDGQTAAHVGIRKSGKSVETLGEVMIRVERPLVEGARAGSAETGGGRAGRGNTEVVLPLLIPGESEVGFAAVGVLHARPPDIHQLFRIKIVVFDPAHEITALVRGANAQRVLRVVLPDVFVAGKKLERLPRVLGSRHNCAVVGHDAIDGVVRVDQIGPDDGICIDAVRGRLI